VQKYVIEAEKSEKRNLESEMEILGRKKGSSALKRDHNLARFADYFVICGLDLENGLEAECFTGMCEIFFR
jgi:uncharacterized ferredoxin-like protein